MKTHNIRIQVRNEKKQGLPQLKVGVWRSFNQKKEKLGEGITDENGNCFLTVRVEESKLVPMVYVKVYEGEHLVYGEKENPVFQLVKKEEVFLVNIPSEAFQNVDEGYSVRGHLVDAKGIDQKGKIVITYHKGVCEEIILGRTKTDEFGRYVIQYSPEKSGVENGQVNLIVKATSRGKKVIAESPLRLDVPKEVTVNLVIGGGAYIPPAKIGELAATLNNALKKCHDATKLSNQDIRIIQKETGENSAQIINYIKADTLSTKTKIEKPVLLALINKVAYSPLEQNEESANLSNTISHPFELDKLHVQMAHIFRHEKNVLVSAIKNSAKDNLIPLTYEDDAEKCFEAFREQYIDYIVSNKLEHTVPSIRVMKLARLQRQEMKNFQKERDNGFPFREEFWNGLVERKILSQNKVNKLLLLANLRNVTEDDWTVVEQLNGDRRIKIGRDLAQFNVNDWHEILGGSRAKRRSKKNDELVERATAISHKVEKRYPTPFFAHRLKESPTFESAKFDTFFKNNAAYEFKTTNLRYYLKKTDKPFKGISQKEVGEFTEELKAMERIFKVTPNANRLPSVEALWEDQLHSSQAIIRKGRRNFININGERLGLETARQIFNNAEHVVAKSTLIMARFGRDFNSVLPAVIPADDFTTLPSPSGGTGGIGIGTGTGGIGSGGIGGTSLSGADPMEVLEQAGLEVADLETLFGALDYCACKHCRSVYSPAAYLTDLLKWLDKKDQNTGTGTLKDALFLSKNNEGLTINRRGEIGDILLNCENTNTPMPYIDLVNEMLENAVEPYDDFKLQTTLSIEELKANPEHVNPAAYEKLIEQDYPWNLPFNLWLEEVRVYMNHMGVPYYEFLEILPLPTSMVINVASEYLGISFQERQILLDSSASDATIKKYYGIPDGNSITELIPSNGKIPVLNLMERSGLGYDELLEYLQSLFINPNGKTIVFADASCALSGATLKLTKTELGKLHRFVLLHRKLDWTIIELDKTLKVFGATNIAQNTLLNIANVKKLQQKLDVPLVEMLSWWSNIDIQSYGEELSLYHQLFLTKTVNNPIIKDFELSGSGEPVNTSGHHLNDPLTSANDALIPFITGALSIKQPDFQTILESYIPANADEEKELTVNNLSQVYRISSFCKAVGISVDDYFRLKDLLIYPPVKSLINPAHSPSPADTLEYVERMELMMNSGFTLDELEYLLRQTYNASFEKAKVIESVQLFLTELRSALADIAVVDNPAKTLDEKKQKARKLLSYVKADAQKVNDIIAVVESTSNEELSKQKTLIDDNLIVGLNIEEAITILFPPPPPPPSDPDPDPDPDPEPVYLERLEKRLDFINAELFTHILEEQIPSELEKALVNSLSLFLNLDIRIVERLVQSSFSSGGMNVVSLFTTEAFILGEDEIQIDNYIQQFDVVERLLKASLIFSKVNTKVNDLEFLLENLPFHWLNIKKLPTASDSSYLPLFLFWENLIKVYQVQAKWVRTDSFSFISLLNDVVTIGISDNEERLANVVQPLVEHTKWKELDLTFLLGSESEGFTVSNGQLGNERWLFKMDKLMQLLRKVQVPAEQAFLWNNITPTHEIATAVRNAAKAKHSYKQWLDIAPPLRDVLREKQRDALTAYLVGIGSESLEGRFRDKNALFEYFLIDTEMSSCAMTTRIKLAISSVQLFVQRITMSLEPDLYLTRDCMEEWKWRKNYRVWEANRKVFLYPENWVAPELRTDKTLFFKELEEEILQDDITEESATRIFKNYLEKLDEVAFLEIAGMYKEVDVDADINILHVFARTKSHPHKYFYRKWMDETYWTGWEKVEVDIEGEHLTPVVFKNRLMIFWLQFVEKAKESDPPAEASLPEKYFEIKLFWSEWKGEKWMPKKLSKEFLSSKDIDTNIFKELCFVNSVIGDNESFLSLYIINRQATSSGKFQDIGYFILDGCGDGIKATGFDDTPIHFTNNGSWSSHSPGFIEAKHSYNKFFRDGNELFIRNQSLDQEILFPKSIEKRFKQSYSSKRQYSALVFREEFFYEDKHNAFFIYPDVREFSFFGTPFIQEAHDVSLFSHPKVCMLIKQLNRKGIDGLFKPDINGDAIDQELAYQQVEEKMYMLDYFGEDVMDYLWKIFHSYQKGFMFNISGGYSIYNWEFFFHIPFMIACRLFENQRFPDSKKWLEYIFDPLVTEGETPSRYWRTKPFHNFSGASTIQELMYWLNAGDDEAENQVKLWENSPYNSHLIARMRVVSYMKAVVMKYLDNLIAWGDQLFRRDSIESINEATQLYILAAQVLGRKPELVEREGTPDQSFNELETAGLDSFSNALVELENTGLIGSTSSGTGSSGTSTATGIQALYFCIPNNEKLSGYWTTVADRLFKIRHCMNIEGVVRTLPIFEPPLPVDALVSAAASGVDIGSAVSALSAPLPYYRFQYMIQKAFELVAEVKSLGGALLQAIEKKDAEKIALIRAEHEVGIQESVKALKELSIKEAEETIQSLKISKNMTSERQRYYSSKEYMNKHEKLQLKKMEKAMVFQTISQGLDAIGGVMALIPDFDIGVSGAFGSPVAKVRFGGTHISGSIGYYSKILNILSSIENHKSTKASIKGGYDRRMDNWKFQAEQATLELPQIEKQIAGAEIRKTIAEKDLMTIEKQIENAKEVAVYMEDKFSNVELYDWMKGQVSNLYFQTYQMAYDLAKQAEKCFQHELASFDSSFIEFGYWDSLKKGLLSGEKLYKDLKRMELAYLEHNRRQYELTKHVSLSILDPVALLNLQETGSCDFNIPEILFDLDFPGQYMRRIKSVSISIPCVVGPYTGVNTKLTLLSNKIRHEQSYGTDAEYSDMNEVDFYHNLVGIQSIATSTAQNDSGVFQLNFEDSRYLPFEGAGVISSWRLELPKEFRQFDYDTISDAIIHINYTAKDGGAHFKNSIVVPHLDANINDVLNQLSVDGMGFQRLLSLKKEFPDEFYGFLNPPTGSDPSTILKMTKKHFPFLMRNRDVNIKNISILLKLKGGDFEDWPFPTKLVWTINRLLPSESESYEFSDSLQSYPVPTFSLNDPRFGGLPAFTLFGDGTDDFPSTDGIELEEIDSFVLEIDVTPEDVGDVEDVMILFEYTI